jgi:hypothetical protein
MSAAARYFLIIFFFSISTFFAQETFFEFSGKALKNNKPMAGVKVLLYKSGVKVSEMTTGKNGQYGFDLDFGFDYKVVFTAPAHIDQHVVIYASKLKESKRPAIYDGQVIMLESSDPTINKDHFKNPYTKIIWVAAKSRFEDEEPYMTNFQTGIKVDLEKIKRDEEERMLAEKLKREKDEAARLKFEAEEKARQEQLLAAQKKALEEAEAQRKMMDEKKRMEEEKLAEKNKVKTNIAEKEEKANEENLNENLKLTIESEQKKIKEKQNKGVKIAYENDLIKMVAANERMMREKEFKKQKEVAYTNEIIETLKEEAVLKAKADEVRYNQKQKVKLANLNSQIKNQEMTGLLKNVASNERAEKEAKIKTYPSLSNYKPKNPAGISTDLQQDKFKSVYTVKVYVDGVTTEYRREKYSWGAIYYYKNNQEIPGEQYKSELSKFKVPL